MSNVRWYGAVERSPTPHSSPELAGLQARMDLPGEGFDLLGQFLVLLSEVGVGREQGLELVGLLLDRSLAFLHVAHDLFPVCLQLVERDFVAIGLPCLR